MPTLIIRVEHDADNEELIHTIDEMLDGGSLQDAIAKAHNDLTGGDVDFLDCRVTTEAGFPRLLSVDELQAMQGVFADAAVTYESPPCVPVAAPFPQPCPGGCGKPETACACEGEG